ncbi:MAG TPA: hypothetical protein VIK81_04170, partial [Patescibacteria group bacterium]
LRLNYLFASLFILAFFLFPTRVHERYLLPVFAFLIVAAFQLKSKFLIAIYLLLTLIHLANLYFVYSYYNNNFLKIELLTNTINQYSNILSILTIGIFFLIYAWIIKQKTI